MPSPQVFLCYASEDARRAARLCNLLKAEGVRVWFDRESLKGGDRWKKKIRQAIRDSRYFIPLMSHRSVSKRGFVQQEIREGLEVLDSYPDDETYVIPVRLDKCSPSHERLNEVQWIDLFKGWEPGVEELVSLIFPARRKNHHLAKVPRKPKTNGIYVARTQGYSRYHYLRFFLDGGVVGCPSPLTPDKIEPHLTQYNPYIGSGVWNKHRGIITFTTESNEGRIDYRGLLEPEALVLMKHSHINGYRGVEKYTFRSLSSLDKGR